MKTVEQTMIREVVTIGLRQTVAEAIGLMLERDVSVLPVVDGERLVGVITMRDLLRTLPYRPIEDVIREELITASGEMSVTSAFALMEERRIGQLPVVEASRIVGLITREDILRALGRPVDPLTELPWMVTMRERAVEHLKQGSEIAIIFLDLDNFGVVNKRFGHVVGDQYIKAVAQALQAAIDPARDLLCRYGGDEFVILTVRPREDADGLGRRALDAVVRARPAEATEEYAPSASMGIAGGKRTTERHDIHFAATVDDLITMASLQSTQAKIEKAGLTTLPVEPPRPAEARLHLRRVGLTTEGPDATAVVELGRGERRYLGWTKGPNLGTIPLRSLAEATLKAISQALPAGWRIAVDDLRLVRTSSDTLVSVTVLLEQAGGTPERHAGTVIAGDDPGQAAVKATLHALNRRLSRILE